MDYTVDITPTLGPAKDYIVAFGHLKLIRDRSNNDKSKSAPREMKKSTASKLPRNTHCTSSSKRINPKLNGQTNLSDIASTSKQTNQKLKLERSAEEKYKPSLIPRRKPNPKETPSREPSASSIKSLPNRIKPNIQQRNVQRVQLLNINPDLFREIRSPPKSVIRARPIPPLGHIYRQDLSNDTFTDWFLESVDEFHESYNNSVETTSTATDYSATTCISVNNNEIDNFNRTDVTNLPPMKNTPAPLKIFKTTNENVSEWLSTELDHPTRDNESGYRSMSPMSKIAMNITIKPVSCDNNLQDEKLKKNQNTLKITSSNNIPGKESVSDTFLSTQPTIIIKKKNKSNSSRSIFAIPKTNTDIKQHDYYPDFHKPLKYHSTPNPTRKREAMDKNPAASYVEYPSEVLQKTTNFESDGRGNLSSQSTFKHNTDSDSTFNGMEWSKLHSSQGTIKNTSTSESWRSNGFDDKHGILTSEKCSYHDYCYHYCWRKEVAKKDIDEQSLWDYRGRCKRCHKYRRSPSRKKLGQPFRYLRKRMTIGVCRYRLNRVWKKTTEKWASWSKSPSRLRRFRMMNYLQKSIIWDNANVQTTVFVYHETGTDAVAREQKSAEICASLKLNSRSYKNDASDITERRVRTPLKHANIGPSMFPFLRYSSNNTLILGRTSDQSKLSFGNDTLNTGAKVKEIKSINTQCSNTQKNTVEEVLETSLAGPKVIREMIDSTSMKLKHAVSQDAYTQVVIMCNNADTNIIFTPTAVNRSEKSPSFSQDLLYFGVDAGTDPIPTDKISQRSINVMTSKGLLQELTHIETQVSPSVSLRKFSTGVLAKDIYQDAKSSVITDTTLPCRRFENTLVTPKGTILSCTGTKITSVSSANIQTTSTISKILKPFTVNTAVSTFANTKRMDSSTAPFVCWPKLENVSLETDTLEVMKSEKSTSQIHLENNLDVGVSGSDVVKKASFNCGSHHTQCNFGAAIQPDCKSVFINTDADPVSKCTSTLDSDQRSSKKKVVDNCHTQYSSFLRDGSWSQDGCPRIGRSQLLSVRALLPDATDDAAQAQPSRLSAETKTTPKQKMSASMLTSRIAFGERLQPIEMNLDADHILTLNRAQVRSDNEAGAVPCHDNVPTTVTQVSSKTSKRSKHPSVLTNKQRSRVKSGSPSVVISSHLNASKWMNQSANENKNIHSILTASASTVSESLERATLVASSADKLTAPEIHQLSKVLVNPQPAINCATSFTTFSVSAKPYGHVSSTSFTRNAVNKANQPVVNETKSPTLTVDQVTSDEVVVKDVKESILQVRPELCDTATDCGILGHKSASVLTSRHVLPKNCACCGEKDARNDTDCLFVYDRPRCVIHSCFVDAAIQMQPSQKEKVNTKRSSSQRSIGTTTSLPCQVCCNRKSEVIGEALPPRVYKALYDATKLVIKEGSGSRSSRHSSTESNSDKGEKEANKVTSQMTSCLGIAPAQCCCMRCIQIGHTDDRSIQAVKNSFQHCPNCSAKITDLQKVDSVIRHLAPSIEESMDQLEIPNVHAEAFTMKPSGKQDENCEAKINVHNIHNSLNASCCLSSAMSATDLRGQDKQDLKTVYYILSAIEGRVRRLKSNLIN